MQVSYINSLNQIEAVIEFTRCCGSHRWVERMVAARPFASEEQMFAKADEIWISLEAEDWKEAFAHHPKIGDLDSLRKKFASTAGWASGEQAGVEQANEDVLNRLARGNNDYLKKFGYIFIVCATGKSADEMLLLLEKRLHNNPTEELRIAAGEQQKITRIRLEKLCREVPSQPMC